MSPSTPYLFVEIWVPKHNKRYTHPTYGWPSIVGDFIRPLVLTHPGLLIFFLQEGPHFQVCFAHPNLAAVQKTMRATARARGFHIKRYIRGSTLGGALGGTRWVAEARQGTETEAMRSMLLCHACHAVCAVYLHSLVRIKGKEGYWWPEAPQCTRQNPHGSLFESFMHLVANISGARFDVELKARTRWMHGGWQDARVVCHL